MYTGKWRTVYYNGYGRLVVIKRELPSKELAEQTKEDFLKAKMRTLKIDMRGAIETFDPFTEEESTQVEVLELRASVGL